MLRHSSTFLHSQRGSDSRKSSAHLIALQVLGLHGLTTGSKFNKQDTLDRMAGLRLFDPKHLMSEPQQDQHIQSVSVRSVC